MVVVKADSGGVLSKWDVNKASIKTMNARLVLTRALAVRSRVFGSASAQELQLSKLYIVFASSSAV
jgi:hypothetical protein